jgi:hypothetical protein
MEDAGGSRRLEELTIGVSPSDVFHSNITKATWAGIHTFAIVTGEQRPKKKTGMASV